MTEPECPNCRGLLNAMITRGTIEQAKGMIMYARGIDADEAWTVLVYHSQHTNRRIRDVAADLIAGTVDARTCGEIEPRPNRRHRRRNART
jgi:hypothetical protein